jgi:hypothetical protein
MFVSIPIQPMKRWAIIIVGFADFFRKGEPG